ncbi:hypothetical protein BVRB_4g072850 [Beta vulgaris subsp. vulgaris]|nr:hypothetical protein BVRB_4g072850 [Beta vulgaris subsp. vulgaris]
MMVSLFIDPLFFFSPKVRVQQDHLCVENDTTLDTTFIILRSVNDVFYWLHILFQFRTAYVAPSSRVFGIGELIIDPTHIAIRYLNKAFWMDFVAALPIPQVLVWAVIPNVEGSIIWDPKIVLRFIIFFQYLFRLYRIYPLSIQAINATGVVSETIWLRAALDLLLFYVASHISGACWYLFTIERQEECWKSVCDQERNSCGYEVFDCRRGSFVSSNATRLCDPDSGYYQFGIYTLGVTTGASSSPFIYKYSFALWIGLQAICSTGQTLVPSIYISENIYCVIVGTLGLLFLASLITNMQRNLLSITARLEEWRLKRNDIEEWMQHRQLPPELKQHVQRCDRNKWLATRGVDEKSLLTAFPGELQREVKRHLCLNLVRQVPVFDQMDELTLDVICERLEPAHYTEGTFLVREGDPVSEISFIIRGQLDSYTTDGGRTGFFSSSQISHGGFCGEELLIWVLDSCPDDTLPPSTRTIRAISDVETFCLTAKDLKFVASQFPTLHSRNLRHKFKLYSQQWRMWAACYIQAAWLRYKRQKRLAALTSEDPEMDIFVPRPDAGIEVYAARLITNLRWEKSNRYSSDSDRLSHSLMVMESQLSSDHDSISS